MKQRFLSVAIAMFAGAMMAACTTDATENVAPAAADSGLETRGGGVAPTTAVYIEVNDVNPRNAGSYDLTTGKFFDVAILFAANIRAEGNNGADATLYFNDNVTEILTDWAQYIEPLQEDGIKVVLSILGDHTGRGIGNMDKDQAEKFAEILAYAVDEYKLDGIDFDDEWAKYGTNGFPAANANSFKWLVEKLRALLPAEKLITVFNIGVASTLDATAWGCVDYAFYPYFGVTTFNTASKPSSLSASKWSPMALDLNSSTTYSALYQSTIQSNAKKTKDQGFGAIEMYNLRPTTERNPLTVLQRIATGCSWGTVTWDGNNYSKNWATGGPGLTITYADI